MSLDHYLTKWGLAMPAKLCETPTSHIYKVQYKGETAILKLLTPIGRRHEAKAAGVLEYFDGVGAVRLLGADERAHLLEYLPGRLLKELVVNGQDHEATEVICSVLDRLHASSGPMPSGLLSMRENFRALFALASSNSADSLFVEGAEVAETLLSSERDMRVLHGDIHHKNVIESDDRGWLVIDPQCLLGERTYDTANTFFNPDDMASFVETPERIRTTCEIFSKRLGLDPKRILDFAFAYGCLSSAWCMEDGLSPERRLRITRLLARVREG